MFTRSLPAPGPRDGDLLSVGPPADGQDDAPTRYLYRRVLGRLAPLRGVLTIEAKATRKVTADHLKGLRHLVRDHPRVGEGIVVCLEPRARRTDEGILILPAQEFGERIAEVLASDR